MIIRDFNEVLRPKERKGGASWTRSMEEFSD